jgi:response regulator RpfG family c-di-GMP phosphodiesterase
LIVEEEEEVKSPPIEDDYADVLIVDDNIFNLIVIEETLRAYYQVTCLKANNGREAVQAVDRRMERLPPNFNYRSS